MVRTHSQIHVFRTTAGEAPACWVVADEVGNTVVARQSWSLREAKNVFAKRFYPISDPPIVHENLGNVADVMEILSKLQKGAVDSPGDKPHISNSQLDMYCRCGEQYRRRYLEKEILPPGIALHRGKAYHSAAEHNFRQKLETREDLSLRDIVDYAVTSFDAGVEGDGVLLNSDEEATGKARVLAEARDETARYATGFAQSQAPNYQPLLIEEKVRIPLPTSSRDLLGVIDLMDENRRVVDFKTANRSKSQADADDATQLTVYAAAVTYKTGEPPASLRLDVLVDKSKGMERQVLESQRTRADVLVLANRIEVVSKAIDAGVFVPPQPGATVWWCSAKFCGYHSTCPYVRAGVKR